MTFVRTSIGYLLSNGIYSSYFNQSMDSANTQNQINWIKKQIIYQMKKYHQIKLLKNIFQPKKEIVFCMITKEIILRYLIEFPSKMEAKNKQFMYGVNQLKKNNEQNFRKSKFTLNSNDVQRLNSQIFIDQSYQKNIQKNCKILSMQISNVFNAINQQPSESKRVSDDLILNNFDQIQNYKKFFPHNNFCNIIGKSNPSFQFKQKKKNKSSIGSQTQKAKQYFYYVKLCKKINILQLSMTKLVIFINRLLKIQAFIFILWSISKE
ncbi:hypothetical protein ABPG72_021805 [Tetrahymena utriculariae]